MIARFKPLPSPDDPTMTEPLEDTPANRALLVTGDPRLVWSCLNAPWGGRAIGRIGHGAFTSVRSHGTRLRRSSL